MDINTKFDFKKCLNLIETMGKNIYYPDFKILPEDHEIIFKLLVYFLKDTSSAGKYNISLRKGIMLSGPIGCGKTSLMNIIRHFQPQEHRFIIKSCRDISFEFIQDGYTIIQKYSTNSFRYYQPKTWCFDDLGTENNLKYYGNDCNIMAEILLSRYDLFISYHMLTHITTNFNSSEIEKMYGERVRSRLREQFNLISFGANAKDKRS